jgi:hypothetical protein
MTEAILKKVSLYTYFLQVRGRESMRVSDRIGSFERDPKESLGAARRHTESSAVELRSTPPDTLREVANQY